MNLVVENISDQSKLSWNSSLTPPEGWDEFISVNNGSIYHGSLWAKTLEEGYGAKTLYVYATQDGKIRAGICGTLFYFLFFRIFFSSMPYGGVTGDFQSAADLISHLEPQLKKYGVHQSRITRISRHPFPQLKGYRENVAFQHLLDLRGKTPEILWRDYRKNNRRDISKAERSGIRAVEGRFPEDLKVYRALYDETMRRNGSLRLYSADFYESVQKYWLSKGKAAVLFAEYQGKKIAGILLIDSEDTSYLFGSVSTAEYLKLCPNDLLIHQALLRTLKTGRRYFDFMMSGSQDKALVQFKEKWGAVPLPFSTFEKDLSPLRASMWRFLWKISTSKLGVLLVTRWENIKSWLGK